MNQQDLTRLETEAAEIIGAMKDLFKECEKRIGELVSVQRVSASEARTEGAEAVQQLQELTRCSKSIVDEQRSLLARIEQEWQLRVDSNAQRAGEAQAKAFGESIARGLEGRLAELAARIDASIHQLTWKSSIRWTLGIALAIPLTVAIGVSAFVPSPSAEQKPIVERSALSPPDFGKPVAPIGLSAAKVREVLSKVSVCEVAKTADWHACIEVDSPPRMGLGSVDKPRVVVRGM